MTDSDSEVQFNLLRTRGDTLEPAEKDDSANEVDQAAYYTMPSASDTDGDDETQDVTRRNSDDNGGLMPNNNVNSNKDGSGDIQYGEQYMVPQPSNVENRRTRRRVNFDKHGGEVYNDSDIQNAGSERRQRRRGAASRYTSNRNQYSDSDECGDDEGQVFHKPNRINREQRFRRGQNSEDAYNTGFNEGYESDGESNNLYYRANGRRTKSHLPVIKPGIYDGTEDWESYFSHFLNCADLGKWSDEEKALTLASCLKGSARTYYLGLRTREQRLYIVLVQKLSERFGSTRQQTRYLTKFETRKRNAGEAVASYGDDLRLLARRAYPDLGTEAQESLALHQLYKNISPDLKYRCMDRNCNTIEQAVEIVERCESILGIDDKKRSAIRNITNSGNASTSTTVKGGAGKVTIEGEIMNQMQNILSRLDKMEAKIEKAGTNERDERRRGDRYERRFTGCYLCKGMDHYARDCPKRGQKSENFRPLA